jgi:hypothetical protein
MKIRRRLAMVICAAAGMACAEGFAPGQPVNLAIIPVLSEAMPGVLSGDLDELHIRVTRVPSGAVVVDTTVAVDTAGNVDLPLTIPLFSDPEQFEVFLEGIRAADAAILYSGVDTVSVSAATSEPPPVEIPVSYVGPCQATSGCAVTVGPIGATLAQGDSVLMAVVVDSSGVPVLGVPVSLINLDTSLVAVRSSRYVVARTGTPGGQARVIARIRSDEDTLAVSVIVPTQPAIGLSTTTVAFNATAFGGNPAAKTVNVTNAGTGTLTGLGVATIYGPGATGWLGASLNTTTAPATVTLAATTGALAAGTYTATVQVSSPVAGNSPQTVNVSFVVAAAVPATVIVTPGYGAIRTTAPNQTLQLSDTVKEAGGVLLPPSLANWTSRSPSIASVNATGLVTGLSAGSAVIVAQAGSASDSMIVTVGNAAAAPGDMLIAAITNNRAFGARRVGQAVTVEVRVDQLATNDSLGSYNARFSWNPAVLRFDSTSAGNYAAPTVNDSSSIGVLRFAGVDANSRSGSLVLTRLWFTALTTGSDAHQLQISEISGVSPGFINYFQSGRYVLVSGSARITP